MPNYQYFKVILNHADGNLLFKKIGMQQEYILYSFINTTKKEYHDIFRNYDRPALSFSGQIARRPGYFLNNAYLLMCKYL